MSHEIKYCILIFGQTSSGVYGGDEREARKARREDGGIRIVLFNVFRQTLSLCQFELS